MDGGGRFLQPLTAGFAGGPGAHVSTFAFTAPAFFQSPADSRSGLTRFEGAGGKPPRRASRRNGRPLPRFLGTWLALGFFATTVGVGLSEGGHLDALIARHGAPQHIAARLLGFGIDRVTISGLRHLTENEVLAAAGIRPGLSLPFLDIAAARESLESLPLVRSASVRKLYPGEVVISLEEREAHALWQRDGEISVVAADGAVIDSFQDDPRYVHLPLVVGETANRATREYLTLIEAAGPLAARIRAGTLVADRRWTLKLDNGVDVRLPEQDPRGALARLVALEQQHRLLEKDIIAVDLRLPDRVVVRLTEEAAAARAEALKKKPVRGKGVDT